MPVACVAVPRDSDTMVMRRRLAQNDIGLIETLRIVGPAAPPPRSESYSPDFQVCLPYDGSFVWHVGRDDVLGDPNRVLFVSGGEGFRMSRPTPRGYAELIVTIQPALLGELLQVPASRLPDHPLFRERSRPASARLQRQTATLLHRHARMRGDRLASEEGLLELLGTAFSEPQRTMSISPSTSRLLTRAKAYLAANLAAPVRLADVARAAGTSPAYLTTVFRRSEGRPLHQYLVQLRLARALVELPHASDLTTLACELGFSTHSHFTSAFRRAFGCTPSQYRASGPIGLRARRVRGPRA